VAPVLLAVLLAAGPRLDAAIESGGSMRSPLQGESVQDTSRLLQIEPSLSAFLEERGAELRARYAPRFWLGDANGVRHDGELSGKWEATRNLQWTASQRLRYGRSELSWDPGARRPFDVLEALLPVVPDELVSDSELGLHYRASRNVSLYAGGGYLASGGLSQSSQQLLPLQRGPQLYAGLDQQLTRSDRISTDFYGSYTFVSGGRRNSLLEVSESWQRQLGAATRSRLALGGSIYRRARPESVSAGLFPVGSASLEHDLLGRSQRLELRALAELGPHQSRLSGDLLERAEAGASARWVMAEKFSLRGRGALAQELGGARLLLGTFDAVYRLRPDISFTAGVEALWQDLPAANAQGPFHWMAFSALNVAVRDIL
jgi:hypothetical protein